MSNNNNNNNEQEYKEEDTMDLDEMNRTSGIISSLPESTQEEIIELCETVASSRAAGVLVETIANLQEAVLEAETKAGMAQEAVEGLAEAVDEYSDYVVEEWELCREENSELLNLLDATLQILGVPAEEVFKKAALLARRGAVDRGDSYTDRVSVDNSARNRKSIRGQNFSRGVNGLGDQGGVIKEEELARVEFYNEFINRGNKGGGLLSPQRSTVSQAAVVQALSESELNAKANEIRKGDIYADMIDDLEERRRIGLIRS
jgi:hypothetical protein